MRNLASGAIVVNDLWVGTAADASGTRTEMHSVEELNILAAEMLEHQGAAWFYDLARKLRKSYHPRRKFSLTSGTHTAIHCIPRQIRLVTSISPMSSDHRTKKSSHHSMILDLEHWKTPFKWLRSKNWHHSPITAQVAETTLATS